MSRIPLPTLGRCLALGILVVLASGCGAKFGKFSAKVVEIDFAENRLAELALTERVTGAKEYFFLSIPKKTEFLEGYIQGLVTDYQDTPIQGVVVRVAASGGTSAGEASGFESATFDPGVSDTNGNYRVKFSVPIVGGTVDLRGRLLYNPGWEQEKANLGKTYEPQLKDSTFRLFYHRKSGLLAFVEGIRKVIVQPTALLEKPRLPALPGVRAPEAEVKKEGGEAAKAEGEGELFKGFGFGE